MIPKRYSMAAMEQAVAFVVDKQHGVAEASRRFGIPPSTLKRRVREARAARQRAPSQDDAAASATANSASGDAQTKRRKGRITKKTRIVKPSALKAAPRNHALVPAVSISYDDAAAATAAASQEAVAGIGSDMLIPLSPSSLASRSPARDNFEPTGLPSAAAEARDAMQLILPEEVGPAQGVLGYCRQFSGSTQHFAHYSSDELFLLSLKEGIQNLPLRSKELIKIRILQMIFDARFPDGQEPCA